ncbi:hypothetical protein DFH09DRAFT_1329373 [Mycena vulgaris]|nr:hypothetical protein DFH09DRAFT_1329373 [Mycena vulgaris]
MSHKEVSNARHYREHSREQDGWTVLAPPPAAGDLWPWVFGFHQLLARRRRRTLLSQTSTPASTPRGTAREPSSSQPIALTKYRTEGRKNLEQQADDAFIELFVCCGIPRRFIWREEFTHFVNAVSQGNYKVTSRTKFEDALVPAYAASLRTAVIEHLRICWFLTITISTDGGKLSKKKFVSVHITNVHRQSFGVDLDDVSRVSQTGEYFAELLAKARKGLGISRGLQSVGETRFATIYWSFDSVLRGIPEFSSIVRNRALGIDAEMLEKPFLDDEDVYKFRRHLTRLGSVLMPFTWGIQCLESKDTTPANVYLYWLAIVAQLNDLINKDDDAGDKSKYATTVKELIRSIANFQFSRLIEKERASKVYSTVFGLDPGVFLTIEALGVQPVTLSSTAGQLAVKEELPLIQRIGSSLRGNAAQNIAPIAPSRTRTSLTVCPQMPSVYCLSSSRTS